MSFRRLGGSERYGACDDAVARAIAFAYGSGSASGSGSGVMFAYGDGFMFGFAFGFGAAFVFGVAFVYVFGSHLISRDADDENGRSPVARSAGIWYTVPDHRTINDKRGKQ